MAETPCASATHSSYDRAMIPLRDNIRSTRYPLVNTAIIATCVVVFLYQWLDPQVMAAYAFRPAYLASLSTLGDADAATAGGSLVLSMFMHGGLLHLGFNMLFLWVFGDNVEDRMGHLRYLIFYLLCGILATLAHSAISFLSVPISGVAGLQIGLIGASGAIAGVLGAYYKLFKGAYIRTLVPIFIIFTTVDLPAGLFIIIWFALQLLYGLGSLGSVGGGIAFWAHIGGFVAGVYLVRLFVRGTRPPRAPRILHVDFH